MKTIKTGVLYRALDDDLVIDEENRTVKLSFSSEEPVSRWDGNEILDHDPSSIRLDRLNSGGPVLVDHNMSDHVGVVEKVSIDADRKGRAVVRFGKSERATEIFNDVVDGIRKSVSVGYRVFKAVTENEDNYRVIDWMPLEISMVSVPADQFVGVGRSDDGENDFLIEERTMKDTEKKAALEDKPVEQKEEKREIDIEAIKSEAIKTEQKRISELTDMGRKLNLNELAEKHIKDGKSVDEFNASAIRVISNKEENPMKDNDIKIDERAVDHFSEKEANNFSIVRALNAMANPTDKRAQEAASYEFEMSRAASEAEGKEVRGIYVPNQVLKRDLTVGTTTAGGHTVSTDLLSGSFIDVLRARSTVMPLATVISGLQGNVAIPRQTGGATAYWVAESGAPTKSEQAFDQVSLTPKTVGAYTDISRKLLLQSSIDVESFVRNDLATVLALAIDNKAIAGDGTSNTPVGIINQTGVNSVAVVDAGMIPTFAEVVSFETAIATDNALLGNLAYLTNPTIKGSLKTTAKDTGSGIMLWENDQLNGYQAIASTQCPATNFIMGNFADLIIGMWGGLDIMADPYTGSTSGTVRVVALQDVDVAVRHPESFGVGA